MFFLAEVILLNKKNKSVVSLFRSCCVVEDGTLDRRRLRVSGDALDEVRFFVKDGRSRGLARERLVRRMAMLSARVCMRDGCCTVLRRHVIAANAFIKPEEY